MESQMKPVRTEDAQRVLDLMTSARAKLHPGAGIYAWVEVVGGSSYIMGKFTNREFNRALGLATKNVEVCRADP